MMKKEFKLKNAERSRNTEGFIRTFEKRIEGNPPGTCPIAMHIAYLRTARSQSCGKCVPCSKGLEQLEFLMQKIFDGIGSLDDLVEMYWLVNVIGETADCAVGYNTAKVLNKAFHSYREEYLSHINDHMCAADVAAKVPCMYNCPANVNVPGYISLIAEGRYEDAVELIRENNPFPTACAYVCEKPCEGQCRRALIDAPVNIRGLKRYAVEQIQADKLPGPSRGENTGKKIAVVGAGPSGLTCAYFLARMGHNVTVYDSNEKPGGMLSYGIPAYRLPKDRLDQDIRAIMNVGGIELKCSVKVGRDIAFETIREEYSAVYISIGAQRGKIIPVTGYDLPGVESAVDMLHKVGDGNAPDLKGKDVVVIGGGNVAVDCARTAIRCGAKSVTISVREHQEDMTASLNEIQGAIEEGAALMTMYAPRMIVSDENGNITGVRLKPQITSVYDEEIFLPTVRDADLPEIELPCNVLYMAIGQAVEPEGFSCCAFSKQAGFITDETTKLKDEEGVWAGGDCAGGPATVVKAVAAGRIAAYNIDEYLGYHHSLKSDIKLPEAAVNERCPVGRVNMKERFARDRKNDFGAVELCMSDEEAMQECGKCLRCDVFGSGSMEGGLV